MTENTQIPVEADPEEAAAPAEAAPPTWRLERRADERLWIAWSDGREVPVKARRPFPWSAPDAFVSLADDDDVEQLLIPDVNTLDAGTQALLEQALAPVAFVFSVNRIESIETEFEIRNWQVDTRQGRRTFQTKHDRWPLPLPGGGYLIRDIESNLYQVPPVDQLDPHSRKLLWPFVD
jgi:hypothetical protein